MASASRPTIPSWRFRLFLGVLGVALPPAALQLGWPRGMLVSFDLAALLFIASVGWLLRRSRDADDMRRRAARNDANRGLLLAITGLVMAALMVAVGLELTGRHQPSASRTALVLGTLALAWLFSNLVYALHYAHLFYRSGPDGDRRGLAIPGADGQPDYWDFIYFAFTLGMTFQTSDIEIGDGAMRRVALFHSLAAFIFNLGIVAFVINLVGSG